MPNDRPSWIALALNLILSPVYFGYLFVCFLYSWIGLTIREWLLKRRLRGLDRIVEWRQVRSSLLADSNMYFIVELWETGRGFGWLCSNELCRQLPRYNEYLSQRVGFFVEHIGKDGVTDLQGKIANACLESGRAIPKVPHEKIDSDADLPKDRIVIFYGTIN